MSLDSERWRLHVTRLGSFLKNARALRGLLDDAHEKDDDEFIFDGQYPVSLLDKTRDHLDSLLYDASLLGLDAQKLGHAEERCQAAARKLYEMNHDDVPDDDLALYQLEHVLSWMEGPTQLDAPTVIDVVHQTIDELFATFTEGEPRVSAKATTTLSVAGGPTLEVIDLGGGLPVSVDAEPALSNLRCEPLKLLLAGALEEMTSADRPSAQQESWFVAIDRFRLSLRRKSPTPPLFLEATHTGRPSNDWLFLYQPAHTDEPEWAADDAWLEETDRGRALWFTGADGSVEEVFFAVGAQLWSGSH